MNRLSHLSPSAALPSSTPFPYRERVLQTVSTGVSAVDAFIGGLPRGALTEICGPSCSGRTALFLAALAERTAQGEVCGLVDGSDNFDPVFARSAGVLLDQLLWVRCASSSGSARGLNQALRAADLLIQAGGFGFIGVDLSDVSPRLVRQIPLSLWFRFRRAVEDTSTILMVLEQDPNAKTCASLVLRFISEAARWKLASQPHAEPRLVNPPVNLTEPCLLSGLSTRMEIVRSRIRSSAGSVIDFGSRKFSRQELHPQSLAARPSAVEIEAAWNIPDSRAVAP